MGVNFISRERGGEKEKKERHIVRDENWRWNAINSSGVEWSGFIREGGEEGEGIRR